MPAPLKHQPDLTQAVRDTVTVRGRGPRSNTTQHVPPFSKKFTYSPPQSTRSPPSTTPNTTQPSAHSQDPKLKSKSKKGSQHADVIDRLDFTGVGPMFHHDGPFDACAPSRNRQPNKAPIFAWASRPDDPISSTGSAYPAHDAYKAFSNTNYPDPPKKKVDAIAEAWGIHEPEPYEEFFAGGGTGRADADTPASSLYNGRDSHKKRPVDPSPRTTKRSVPPPQPIFVSDDPDLVQQPPHSPPLSPGGNPQRKKSLMHRIRKMRDAPNVPVGADYDQPPSPTESSAAQRPTHRSQNSFLGRFRTPNPPSEPFVYIEQNNKELPPPPRNESPPDATNYFDSPNHASPGVARKTSLMKKVGRVVGRTRQ
ncbi:hypothetical protein C0991_000235 [Blastosporella zonata]|nr:hypothetical protein C0991_000235 [Blastosporella zonata]